ncbi:hypothetical protein [Komagataeibacter xylinus]|uniref:hypothetical protein n=1 Tax=Komagataeibacter xylinus TaxID=28448 RepID=UPI001013D73C|nr:hypothetical protein [Komagataeibacter xylinus]
MFLSNKKNLTNFFVLFISIMFGYYEALKFYEINDISVTISATEHLLKGYTHWRAFQNRLLSPLLVKYISKIFHINYYDSLMFFLSVSFILINIILQINLLNKNFSEKLISLLCVNFGFFLFSCGIWYPWDFIEFISFYFLFMINSKDQKYTYHYWIIFIIWSTNKETSIFVPITFFVSNFKFENKLFLYKDNIKIIINSFIMFILIFSYTYVIRNFMFKYSTIPGVGLDIHNKGLGNFINLERNFYSLIYLNEKNSVISFIIYLIYIIFTLNVLRFRKIMGRKFVSLWFIVGLYLIVGFISGLVNETRLFFPLSAMAVGLYFSQDVFKFNFERNKSLI